MFFWFNKIIVTDCFLIFVSNKSFQQIPNIIYEFIVISDHSPVKLINVKVIKIDILPKFLYLF